MYSEQVLNHITGQVSQRFDGVPTDTVRAIVRETLLARETARFDGDHPDDETDKARNVGAELRDKLRDSAKGRTDGKRDAATDGIRNMWKKEQGQ